jgi:hypothetical protein
MTLNRREFFKLGIAGVLATSVPPAYARAASLMPIVARKTVTLASSGLCYYVIDSLSLVPFGNRVPNFEFEVRGDGRGIYGDVRVKPSLVSLDGIEETVRYRVGNEREDPVKRVKEFDIKSEYTYAARNLTFAAPGGEVRRIWADGIELPLSVAEQRIVHYGLSG